MQQYTWFYTLADGLSPAQKAALQQDFDQFLAQWKSHGTPVRGRIEVLHDRFVMIQADPDDQRPSGCSIDNLKRSVNGMLQQHQLSVLEAAYVSYQDEAGNIQTVHFRDIPALVKAGTLSGTTPVFDHSLDQSDDLSRWQRPLADTWLRRYLSSQSVT